MTDSQNSPGSTDSNDSQNLEGDLDTDLEKEEALAKKKSGDEFAQMLAESFKGAKKKLSVGDKLKGEILVIGREEIYVSTGTMNDGVLSRRELQDETGQVPYKVGDKIDVYVTQVRGSDIHLSSKPGSKNLADDLEDAFDMMLPLEGKVVEVCNGGFRVQVKGKLAFCPISQMDIRRIEVPEEYVGKKFEFRITKFEEGGRNIVVSRRRQLEEDREAGIGNFATEHKAGDIVSGKVARLEKFGAFIELAPGIDGLAHVSELAWARVGDPAEVLQVGQVLNVKILKIETNEGKLRISLSVKQSGDAQAGQDPWSQVHQKFPIGSTVQGKIERREAYGLFVKLDDTITALLPKSKTNDRPDFPFDKLKVGDLVAVAIAEIRSDERRISLEVPKDPGSDDWKGFVAQPSAMSAAAGTGFGTLADKLKAAMEKKKK